MKFLSEDSSEELTVRKFQIGEDTPYLIPVSGWLYYSIISLLTHITVNTGCT